MREREFRAIAMSVFASGAIPAAEAIEWVCAQPNLESIVFGASSARNIRRHATWWLVDSVLETCVTHAARRLDRWSPQAAPPPAPPARGRLRAVSAGSLSTPPQSRSLLAGEERRLRPLHRRPRPAQRRPQPPARAPDPATRRTSARSSAPARRSHCRSSPSARARGLPCHYIESAARMRGSVDDRELVSRIPGVNLYTQYPSWAGGRWHLPRRRLRLLRPSADEAGSEAAAAQGRGHARHLQGTPLRAHRPPPARDPAARGRGALADRCHRRQRSRHRGPPHSS